MKKIGLLILAIVGIIGILVMACGGNGSHTCTHEAEANCTTAKTCTICGKVIITAISHDWSGRWSTTGRVIKTCQNIGCKEILPIYDEMVQIPTGNLTWDGITHTLSSFKMSKYTVTQELYEAVMGTNPSFFSSNPADEEIQGKRPVETVTWFDAIEFCNKLSEREGLKSVYGITEIIRGDAGQITSAVVTPAWTNNGYRLPTESQWEYACHGGQTYPYTKWHFGDAESKLENYAWRDPFANLMTHQVGKKLPNNYGLYDIYGNVYEWCWDKYNFYPQTPQTDYIGPEYLVTKTRTARGGDFFYESAVYFYSAARHQLNPEIKHRGLGIRLVCP